MSSLQDGSTSSINNLNAAMGIIEDYMKKDEIKLSLTEQLSNSLVTGDYIYENTSQFEQEGDLIPYPLSGLITPSDSSFKHTASGILSDIHRFWRSYDNELILWDYLHETKSVQRFKFEGSPIVTVGVVHPKLCDQGECERILIISTFDEISLHFIRFDENEKKNLMQIETVQEYAVSSEDDVIKHIVSHHSSGRVFLASADGRVSELIYGIELAGLFKTRYVRKISKRGLVTKWDRLTDFVTFGIYCSTKAYALKKIKIDQERNLILTLDVKNNVNVYVIPPPSYTTLLSLRDPLAPLPNNKLLELPIHLLYSLKGSDLDTSFRQFLMRHGIYWPSYKTREGKHLTQGESCSVSLLDIEPVSLAVNRNAGTKHILFCLYSTEGFRLYVGDNSNNSTIASSHPARPWGVKMLPPSVRVEFVRSPPSNISNMSSLSSPEIDHVASSPSFTAFIKKSTQQNPSPTTSSPTVFDVTLLEHSYASETRQETLAQDKKLSRPDGGRDGDASFLSTHNSSSLIEVVSHTKIALQDSLPSSLRFSKDSLDTHKSEEPEKILHIEFLPLSHSLSLTYNASVPRRHPLHAHISANTSLPAAVSSLPLSSQIGRLRTMRTPISSTPHSTLIKETHQKIIQTLQTWYRQGLTQKETQDLARLYETDIACERTRDTFAFNDISRGKALTAQEREETVQRLSLLAPFSLREKDPEFVIQWLLAGEPAPHSHSSLSTMLLSASPFSLSHPHSILTSFANDLLAPPIRLALFTTRGVRFLSSVSPKADRDLLSLLSGDETWIQQMRQQLQQQPAVSSHPSGISPISLSSLSLSPSVSVSPSLPEPSWPSRGVVNAFERGRSTANLATESSTLGSKAWNTSGGTVGRNLGRTICSSIPTDTPCVQNIFRWAGEILRPLWNRNVCGRERLEMSTLRTGVSSEKRVYPSICGIRQQFIGEYLMEGERRGEERREEREGRKRGRYREGGMMVAEIFDELVDLSQSLPSTFPSSPSSPYTRRDCELSSLSLNLVSPIFNSIQRQAVAIQIQIVLYVIHLLCQGAPPTINALSSEPLNVLMMKNSFLSLWNLRFLLMKFLDVFKFLDALFGAHSSSSSLWNLQEKNNSYGGLEQLPQNALNKALSPPTYDKILKLKYQDLLLNDATPLVLELVEQKVLPSFEEMRSFCPSLFLDKK